MCILDGSAMPGNSGEDRCPVPQEAQSKQARSVEEMLDNPDKGAECKSVARHKRWGRHSLLGARAIITRAECNRVETGWLVDRCPRCEPNLDPFSARTMGARQARRQRRGIVGDDEVSRIEKRSNRGAHRVAQIAISGHDEEPGGSPAWAVC